MLAIKFKDRTRSNWIRARTKVEDATAKVARSWGRPQMRCSDDFKRIVVELNWKQLAQERPMSKVGRRVVEGKR